MTQIRPPPGIETAAPEPRTPVLPSPVAPGGSAALPPGTLPDPFPGPRGDENRDPRNNAPAPVSPTETVAETITKR